MNSTKAKLENELWAAYAIAFLMLELKLYKLKKQANLPKQEKQQSVVQEKEDAQIHNYLQSIAKI